MQKIAGCCLLLLLAGKESAAADARDDRANPLAPTEEPLRREAEPKEYEQAMATEGARLRVGRPAIARRLLSARVAFPWVRLEERIDSAPCAKSGGGAPWPGVDMRAGTSLPRCS